MSSKRIETEYLLTLISCALRNETAKEREGVDFRALFEEAKKHEVFNLINDEIQNMNCVDSEVKTLFRNHCLSEKSRMIALSAQRNTIYSMLSESKIRFMPLKGLIFKDYYPRESMRQMSDNDILIDEAKREEAASIMEKLGYKPTDLTQNSDDFFKEPYYTFELHRTLFDEASEFSPKFDNIWENAKQDEKNEFLFHMAKEDVYIYSICHMFKHYIKACCGIRFLIDNYLFLKKEESALDWEYINNELEKYSLLDYERQTKALSKKIFENEALSDEEEKLLKNYTEYGIFGNSEGKILQNYSAASSGKNAKSKYILRRLFPKKEEMLFNYPILEKKPFLLPFMLICRFFKGLFNIRKTSDELKSVNKIQKENRG